MWLILEYKNALQLDNKNVQARLGLGKAYLKQNDPRQAFGFFQGALELDPNLEEARFELASLYAFHGEPRKALDELEKVTRPEAFQPRADIVKARALFALKQFRESMKHSKGFLTAKATRRSRHF